MKKSKKLVLCLSMALVMLFCGAAMAFADTIYIGDVGFDMDRMLNDDAYKAKFMTYYAGHVDDTFLVDMAGMIFDVNGYLNAPTGTTMQQYAQQHPSTIPGSAVIWDGTGEPGGSSGGGDFEVIAIE